MSKRLNRSRGNFSLDIDLKEAFGGEVPEDLALAFGQQVIDTILERTENNMSSNGNRFTNYTSEEYINSLEFQAAGKSRTDPNLELTGDMLSDIDILEASTNRLKIGFSDKTQRDKAFNHHTGDTVPDRPFFDLSDKEYNSIIDDFRDDVERRRAPEEESGFTGPSLSTVSLLDILRGLNGEGEDQ